jgi:hypothetical protein
MNELYVQKRVVATAYGSNHIASRCPLSPGINPMTCADGRY